MANTKSVDPSLWWDPFTSLLTDLENASLSSDLPPPLVKKLKGNHTWFVDTVSMFKLPNDKSKEALNSEKVKIGVYELTVWPDLKDRALRISAYLNLDEIQSYILLQRHLEQDDATNDLAAEEFLHMLLLQYYVERQCLLKCARRILIHALYAGTSLKEESNIREQVLKIISDGLERKQISVFEDLLFSTYPEQMDVDLFTLWAEETLIEGNLILDILFLIYYESFCPCNGERWRKLCSLYKGILSGSYNIGKLTVSAEAQRSSYHAKIQLLLILIETLDLETLLQMVHDAVPFRSGPSVFSLTDVLEMDAIISSFNTFEVKEAGSLILAWAVFLCLISALPGKEESSLLMEIDHVGYVRQAFEADSLRYFLEVLQSEALKESAGPVAGYRSVLRTFISAFVASYEINLQLEDATHNLILEILCKVYQGEESLCIQFWDRVSFVDGPIRCLLCNLEGEFPFRTAELIRLLSSLCEGSWPAECVYNFLDKSVGISTLFEITSGALVDNILQIVETFLPLHVPGFEGLVIPSKTRGHILKLVDENTAVVRWEYTLSGIKVLILRLANVLYLDNKEEVLMILGLLNRMVMFNKAICFSLLNIHNFHAQASYMNAETESNVRVVEIICNLVRSSNPNAVGAAMMSMAANILAKLMSCSPSHVADVALKANIFDVASGTSAFNIGYNVPSSGSWLLPGKLAKMILIDCEKNDSGFPLVISVLEFTMQLVETGLENDVVLALVVFSLQYILVSHEYWKYKERSVRWSVTLKVLELMKTCIVSSSLSKKLSGVVRDIVLGDASVHGVLFRIFCTTTQTLEKLCVSRFIEPSEIEGWQLAIGSVLDVLDIALSKFSEDISSSLPVLHQAMLSSTSKPIPVIAAITSLISYFRNPIIQIGAVKVLSRLMNVAESSQLYMFGNVCFSLDDKQIKDLRCSVGRILDDQSAGNTDLIVAIINLLAFAARCQAAFLVTVFSPKDDTDVQPADVKAVTQLEKEASLGSGGTKRSSLLDKILLYVERADDFIHCNTSILLSVLNFLKALWKEAGQYADMLESVKRSGNLWKHLSNLVSQTAGLKDSTVGNMTEEEVFKLSHRYQCQSSVFEVILYDMFLNKKLLYAESLVKQDIESKEKRAIRESKAASDFDPKEIFSNWCDRSVLGSLIVSITSWDRENEMHFKLKVAAALLTVHLIVKLETDGKGSLSVSLVESIHLMSKKICAQHAFSELLAQYSKLGYSEGKELKTLILNDLFYHLQGELEGRDIPTGPFKELFQFLTELNIWKKFKQKYSDNLHATAGDVYLFDIKHVRTALGIDAWDYSEWRASKTTAETMLFYMQNANFVVLLSSSRLSALKALISVLKLYEDNSLEERTVVERKIPSQVTLLSIDDVCKSFSATVDTLNYVWDGPKIVFDLLAAQAELLSQLINSAKKHSSLSVCVLVLRTVGSGLKAIANLRPSVTGVKRTLKLLLDLLLLVVGLGSKILGGTKDNMRSAEDSSEISIVSLGILPLLCNFTSNAEYSTISLATIDLILRSLLTPETWFPVLRKHLHLQHVILQFQDKKCVSSVPIMLKFLLTIARVRGGAEMLLNSGLFSSLGALFTDFSDGKPTSVFNNGNGSLLEKTEKAQQIWGLGLSVVTVIIQSLGGTSSGIDLVDSVISYFFTEKAYMISYYLSSPDFPSDDHDKKRPRTQRTWTSLTYLKETEHTLTLMCLLASHWRSWVKLMKEMDSSLRETCIHLLAFISKGAERFRESRNQNSHLLCPPVLKEEFDCCKKPSFINSKHGWFSLSPLLCTGKPRVTAVSASTALIVKAQTAETRQPASQTYFSDSVALQIYRIAFLLLKFLCLQAEGATKRAEEVGYVDLAHFPELPMPEILHGLQDQAVVIVTELCNANRSEQIDPEIQSVCSLLLQILDMTLYLELCVLQVCRIQPVLGRVEDFSKHIKLLMKAADGYESLNSSLESLKQITSFIYQGLF